MPQSIARVNHRFCACIFVALVFSFHAGYAQESKKELTVEEIFGSSRFQLKTLASPQWVDGGRKFSYLETDTTTKQLDLYLYNVADGSRELLVKGSSLVWKRGGKPDDSSRTRRPMRISSYQWSADRQRILMTGSLPARRLKTGGDFGIFSVADKSFRMLTDTTAEQANIKFSPDGSKIGFVRANNLYVMDVETGMETQLTFDGSENIINGKFDWVYEEEFRIVDGWQWSPDGRHIAFWRLDQSAVPTFPLVRYSELQPHAATESMRYPKAGDPNALVKVGVINVETMQTKWLDLGSNADIYIPRIQWTTKPEILSVQRLNRGQDTLDLMLANLRDGTFKTVTSEADTAWIGIQDSLTFLQKSDQFLWTSNRDGYMHMYLYNLDGSLARQITKGDWEVTRLVGVDEKRKTVYFIGTQASPLERHLYSIKLDGTGMRRLTKEAGTHSVNFSPDFLVYLDTHSSAKTPTNISLRTNEGARVAQVIENNLETLKEYRWGDHQFFTFKTTDGEVLNGWMIKPPDFDATKRYPVLMYVYGGPGSQTVEDQWGGTRYLWHQMFAQRGYIVVSVDNRGTGARGKTFMQITHRRLGVHEVGDQIEAAKYLASLPYVDASRIGIWGWSYGGYMTCMAITLGAEYFKTGVAVAPVTNWKFYDTIYTERYMDTPQRNPEGYKETSPVTHASKVKGNLLIVHGTTDDNVHWQNTIVFVNELITQNKQVQTMFYPGRNHGISGDNATRHLYTMMTNYILEKL